MSATKTSPGTLSSPNMAASPLDADASWGVVIVYDDAPVGKHAMRTLEGVTHQLSGSITLHPLLWRFDLLEDPDCRAAATAEAVQAGLVVISTSSKRELPAAVRDWVYIVKIRGIPQCAKPAGAEAGCGTNPSRRILVIDGHPDIREASAEVPIRHETNSLVKNTSINYTQNQAGNAPSECQL
jgi:hypothetical protein